MAKGQPIKGKGLYHGTKGRGGGGVSPREVVINKRGVA
jgi:hypothetical protein